MTVDPIFDHFEEFLPYFWAFFELWNKNFLQICHVGCQSRGFYTSYPYTTLILHKQWFFTPFLSILGHFYPIFGHFLNSETNFLQICHVGCQSRGIYISYPYTTLILNKNYFLPHFWALWGIFTLFSVIFWTDISCGVSIKMVLNILSI